ncbi:hypothetical protein [Acinetobacter modestus]|uniref:Uncharacterized protein n=1 Tax=Acinetobacter modestus TaxID=1776740 RepID=A0ABN0JP25_9GAMM|nr:hypothetical protein [Acinetobacter modestus]ENU27075.1 hypothetical protein F992_01680 [Acinetobacter modestus]GGA18142.1 hypothetical protein GCM10017554_13710 [Acinetobacter modestus]
MGFFKQLILGALSTLIFFSPAAQAEVRGAPGSVVKLIDIERMNSWNDGYRYWNVIVKNPNNFKAACYVPFLTTKDDDSTPTARHGTPVYINANDTNVGIVTIKKTFKFDSLGDVKCDELRPDAIIEQKKLA